MQITEQTQDKLVLSFRPSLFTNLLIGIGFVLVGTFFCLLGLLLFQRAEEGTWILPSGMGSVLIISGFFWASQFPYATTFTFDKSQNRLLRERQSLLYQSPKQVLELPLSVIAGVEITSSILSDDTTYYPSLILDQVYWRIRLNSSGSYDTAAKIAKTIAQFINVHYFPNESKAPRPIWEQKFLDCAEPYQMSWKYYEEESDRLRRHLSQNPQDAKANQELGILLRWKRQEATFHLEEAERLFEAQQKPDQAAMTKVLRAVVNGNSSPFWGR